MRTTRNRTSRLAVVPLALGLLVGVAACGSDDGGGASEPTDAPSSVAEGEPGDTTVASPASTDHDQHTVSTESSVEPSTTGAANGAVTPTATTEFCDAFIGVDQALQSVPFDDPDSISAYVESELTPRIETVRAAIPEEVTDEVNVMIDAVEAAATTGDFAAFESSEFGEASATMYPYLGPACDVPVVDVLALDYSYGGVPSELDAGSTVFTLTNDSPAGEAHEMSFARVKDDVDLSLEEMFELPLDEVEQLLDLSGGVYAPAGATSGVILDLTPGRWIYVCLIPVGSVDGEEGSGPPHLMEGMSGELTVT